MNVLYKQKKKITHLLLVAVLQCMPTIVNACAMCQAGVTKEYISAYKITTAILVLIPITTVGLLIYWIYRKNRLPG